ncbi:hypothetical protein B0H13DRAFT_1863646 [Mycena leptocephala]|nr:hypothetical protein B0H13DRAFT_1863646 [Mycena leptocephala]
MPQVNLRFPTMRQSNLDSNSAHGYARLPKHIICLSGGQSFWLGGVVESVHTANTPFHWVVEPGMESLKPSPIHSTPYQLSTCTDGHRKPCGRPLPVFHLAHPEQSYPWHPRLIRIAPSGPSAIGVGIPGSPGGARVGDWRESGTPGCQNQPEHPLIENQIRTRRPPHASLDLDTILEVFDDISDHLSRLVASNREFFGDEVVKQALSLIYGDVIKICLQIISTIPRDSQRLSGLGRVGRLFLAVARSMDRIIGTGLLPAPRNQIPQNLGFSSGAVVGKPPLKVLQTEFHRHAQFVADYAVRTKATSSFLHLPSPSRAEVNISTMPPDIILEIFSIVRVIGRRRWWINCFSFASTSRHIRACCMPVLFRRAYLRASEKPSYDLGDKILRCFRYCSISARPEVTVQPATLNKLLLWLSRMQSLESFTFLYASTVPFSAVEKVLTSLPLLCRLDIMHTPCPLIPSFGGFPGHIRQFSFTPALKLVSPPEVRQRQVFDPPDDEEVSAVSAALHSTLRQLQRTVETLDVPIWCFPLEQLRGTPWTGLRILSLRGYLPEDRRPTPTILGLFPYLESLEIEVVRTDPSLIENPQYLWVDSEEARFPSQLKHLSLIDVGTMDPIFRHLPADLDSLSIIDTRSRKYGTNFEVPGYDDDYRTWLTNTEIASTIAGNPQSFAGLTYLRMSISTGRQSSHW